MKEVQEIVSSAPLGASQGIDECWMDFDGARMRYLRTGSGPALILLHGLFGYSFSWRHTMPALAPYRTIYALDLLGAGFSDRPRDIDHSVLGTAKRVVRFAQNLGLESFDLLGTSRGGAVAVATAAICVNAKDTRLPKVRRLVLVCPVNPYSSHGRWLAPFFGTPFGAAGFRWVTSRKPAIVSYFHARLYGDKTQIPADSLEGYKAPFAVPGLLEHGLSIARTWTSDLRDLKAWLSQVSGIPTLLVWGSKDPAVYVSSLERLERHFSNVQKVVFPGIGHLPYEECPERFNAELIKFLTQG